MASPKILFYDIETTPLKAWVWKTGKQVIRHGQLCKGHNMYKILCITYCWNDDKPAKALKWDYDNQDCGEMVTKFDELIKQADYTIGKNSDRFDVKQLNTQRLLHGNSGMPEWVKYTDDLEKQMRKYFYLPSYSLDYFSELLGFGGKLKMEMQDWIDIVEQTKDGKAKFRKMVEYGLKDTEDTRALWNHCVKHFTPRFNQAMYKGEQVCINCGSPNIQKNGTRLSGKTRYQQFFCADHGGYAGRAPLSKKGVEGSIGS